MNADQQMRDIVEKAGEYWQEGNPTRFISTNPSPTDTQELLRLMIKLNYAAEVDIDNIGRSQVSLHADGNLSPKPAGQSIEGLQFVDALREALWQAIQEVS